MKDKDKIMLAVIIAISFVAIIMFLIYPIVFYTLIGVAAFLAIVYLCTKYKWARIATLIVAFVALVGGTAYSFVCLDEYYTTEGGVYGHISDFFGTNIVEVDDLTFNYSNIELTDSGNKTDYTAQKTLEVTYNLDLEKQYAIYINDIPCTTEEITKNYVVSDFTYLFQDDKLEEIATDTLTLRIAFYKNSTQLTLTTSGGMDAVNLWNSYFEKNGLTVKIVETDYAKQDQMQETNGQVEFALANYYNGEEKIMTQVYHIGDAINFPETEINMFIGWGLDPNSKDTVDNYTIKKDTNFYAIDAFIDGLELSSDLHYGRRFANLFHTSWSDAGLNKQIEKAYYFNNELYIYLSYFNEEYTERMGCFTKLKVDPSVTIDMIDTDFLVKYADAHNENYDHIIDYGTVMPTKNVSDLGGDYDRYSSNHGYVSSDVGDVPYLFKDLYVSLNFESHAETTTIHYRYFTNKDYVLTEIKKGEITFTEEDHRLYDSAIDKLLSESVKITH